MSLYHQVPLFLLWKPAHILSLSLLWDHITPLPLLALCPGGRFCWPWTRSLLFYSSPAFEKNCILLFLISLVPQASQISLPLWILESWMSRHCLITSFYIGTICKCSYFWDLEDYWLFICFLNFKHSNAHLLELKFCVEYKRKKSRFIPEILLYMFLSIRFFSRIQNLSVFLE